MVWPQQEWKSEGTAVGDDRGTEMTVGGTIRDPAATREELGDLLAYLEGLPDEMRRTGAFTAYEQRAGELSRELVVADMLLNLKLIVTEPATTSDFVRVYESLSALTREYEHIAERSLKANRALQWAVVAASGGSMVSALTSTTSLVLPFSVVAVSLAGLCVGWLTEHARRQERAATRLSTLREEIVHSFGPSGQVLRPSEYYSASTKRIESLLDEIKETVGP
ncbi:hypothetical protein SBA6_1210004 [Candidatus Sulfopaludibacter sp. SbA6]|nr:hypothetical protein SBA6_1210004 [Candidatus Sulfopaludibacter sp. SbA6]